MSSRPYVADDFEAIRAAGKALGLKHVSTKAAGVAREKEEIDIYYRKIASGRSHIFLSSDKAKKFFKLNYGFGPTKKSLETGYPPDPTVWKTSPANDYFVFAELAAGADVPDGAWG